MSLLHNKKGFTIVELLIVIVVIGILAALVITTFAGIQSRARNTERETDIKAIHGHLETYYADQGNYPGRAGNLDTDSWVDANMVGLDDDALRAPNETANSISDTSTNTADYVYVPSGCTGTSPNQQCTGYTLTANLEGGDTYSKDALN